MLLLTKILRLLPLHMTRHCSTTVLPSGDEGLGYIDKSRQDAFTGPPNLVDFSTDQDANGDDQVNDESYICDNDEVKYVDTFEVSTAVASTK